MGCGGGTCRASPDRIHPHWSGDVLEFLLPEINECFLDPVTHLAVGVIGEADTSRLSNPFEARCNVDAVAHQIAVALLDHVPQVDANAKLDAALGRQPSVALDHAVLHVDGAADGVDDASELDEDAVAGTLDDAAMMQGDGWINQVAAQRPQPRQRSLLVGSGKPALASHIGRQNGREFAGLRHGLPRCVSQSSTITA
jgi:hypothetical protein